MCALYCGYGFAESHAWTFAVAAYATYKSARVPHHYLAAFLFDAPGMWSASTLHHEARRWGVGFLKLELNTSGIIRILERYKGVKWVRPH